MKTKIIDGKKFIFIGIAKNRQAVKNFKELMKQHWSYIRILPATKSEKDQGKYQVWVSE